MIIGFGKYSTLTPEELVATDRRYAAWFLKNVQGEADLKFQIAKAFYQVGTDVITDRGFFHVTGIKDLGDAFQLCCGIVSEKLCADNLIYGIDGKRGGRDRNFVIRKGDWEYPGVDHELKPRPLPVRTLAATVAVNDEDIAF